MGVSAVHTPGAADATVQRDEADIAFLHALPWLADLSPDELAQVEASWHRLDPEPGELIVAESQAAEGLYVVRYGHVRLFRTSRSGKEQVLFVAGPGATFNEEAVGDGGPVVASAQAIEAGTRLYALPIALVAQLHAANARFSAHIARIITGRLRSLAGLVEDLSFQRTAQRVIKLLLDEGQETGMVVLTKQEMAARVGAAREVVSRVLHDLENKGLIQRGHDGMVYVQLHALREHAARGRR
jgi:CRP-like cAMP-binding protein